MSFVIYRLLLPLYVLAALPGWLWKTARRGGFGSGLGERAGFYRGAVEFESCGAVHVHAVSVGESLLALKLIRAWRERDEEARFVLAVGTPTGRAVAADAACGWLRVVYQPVDFRWMVRRYLERFEPAQVVLVEGEMWPHLMLECERRAVPVGLVNARMSPRSRRRYLKLAEWVRPVFSKLAVVAVQEEEDAAVWSALGVDPARVAVTGSLKFDPGSGGAAKRREAFEAMLEVCSAGRPVVLAASTHAGEEELIGRAVREAGGFLLCVPRHAERRAEVRAALEKAGFEVVMRGDFRKPEVADRACLVIDTTGELRDWTMHADVVVIGKSFRGTGGQSPAEAILAGKPLMFGPHMENFEPLASRLVEAGGARRCPDGELARVLAEILSDPRQGEEAATAAREVMARHEGATRRIIGLLSRWKTG